MDLPYRVGDRVELVTMGADPHPIPTGSVGTVRRIVSLGDWTQVSIDWDSGRALSLTVPPDVARKATS